MESFADRAKSLCLRGQFVRPAEILSSLCVAPDNNETLMELKNLKSSEKMPSKAANDNGTQACQFNEDSVLT